MSVTYGFYNSLNGSHKYSAEDISRVFDGLITDGIFEGYGDAFNVTADGADMRVCVGTGRAWFKHTWTHNDNDEYIPIDSVSRQTYKRIDTIVIDVNPDTRVNEIKVIKGEETTGTPVRPTLTNGDGSTSYQYPLADIYLTGDKSTIDQSMITNRRGLESDGTPFVTGLVQSVSVDNLISQWKESFEQWFETVKGILDTDAAGNLTNRVLALDTDVVRLDAWLSDIDQDIKDNNNGILKRLTDVESQSLAIGSTEMHRNIYRGKYLGSAVTDEQWDAIREGNWSDFYIGDYWNINGTNYRIADFNYWLNTGDTNCTIPHIVIVPDSPIDTGATTAWDDARDGLGPGFTGAYKLTNRLNHRDDNMGCYDIIAKAFESVHILSRREYVVTSFTLPTVIGENPTAVLSWAATEVELLNEPMVFGKHILTAPGDSRITVAHQQLALFRLNPSFINTRYNYWLRDIADSKHLVMVQSYGIPYRGHGKENSAHLRPVFAIYCGHLWH